MFAIRCGSVCVGSIHSADNGSDWYNVKRGWTPAKNEATEFETRAEAERVIADKSLANAAIVVDLDDSEYIAQRVDGLNNSMSINSGIGCTWDDVETECEAADCVDSYSRDGDTLTITWVDGQDETFTDPQAAFAAINANR